MTRSFITIIALLMALTTMPSHAQEMTKAEMAGIRAAYSAAKEQIERNSHAQEQNVPRSDMEIVSHYVVPGCGPTEEVIRYYFTPGEDPVLGTPVYSVYFIIRSYNYQRNDALDGGADETRYYYGKNGVHKAIKGTAELDEVFAARTADELKNAFNLLMNKDY